MASGKKSTATSGEDWVVFASFDSARHGEHMFYKLGRGFRKNVREGEATALVVTENPDGSLKLRQSLAVTATGYAGIVLHLSLSWMVGFLGLFSSAKGVGQGVHAAKIHQGHVGSEEHLAHEIIDDAGPRSAIVLVRSNDPVARHAVVAAAGANARRCWDGSFSDFLAELDPGPPHDWVRTALGEAPQGTDVPSEN